MEVHQPKQQEQHAEDYKSAKVDVTVSQGKTHVLPEELSESSKGRKYKDVAAAALEAFESAAYAAQAARAAVELSRYDSNDNEQDDYGDSSHGQGTLYDSDGLLTPELQSRYEASKENKQSNDRLVFNEIHTIDNISSESEDENMKEYERVHLKEFEEIKTKPGFDRTPSNSSSDSNRSKWNERKQLSDSLSHNKPVGKDRVSYFVHNKAEREQVRITSPEHHDLNLYRNTNLLADENQHIRQYNEVHEEDASDEDENKLPYQSPKWIPLKSHADALINPTKGNYEYKIAHSANSDEKLSSRPNIDKKPLSVRTRRAKGA
ncbi:unnamed protein product [Dovyalis caffra]|uniref:Uncharacterized protein n=1 Tax=Dovyalis caffra TaxID=77055 RepID=A0AAV1S1Z5_9ROSI|nr:unnamed protein product [Dovyalis caffra]